MKNKLEYLEKNKTFKDILTKLLPETITRSYSRAVVELRKTHNSSDVFEANKSQFLCDILEFDDKFKFINIELRIGSISRSNK